MMLTRTPATRTLTSRTLTSRTLAPLTALLVVFLTLLLSLIVVLTTDGPAWAQLDSDNDGLTDEAEQSIHGTDPKLADSDGDGLPDGVEVTLETNPLAKDTDTDGATDAEEYLRGSDPLVEDPAQLPEPAADAATPAAPGPQSSTSVIPDPEVLDSAVTVDDLDAAPEALAFADDTSQSGSPAWYLLPFAMTAAMWILVKDRVHTLGAKR